MATEHLRRRLDLWTADNLPSLLDEGRCLQATFNRRPPGGKFQGEKDLAHEFGQCMASGNVHQALRKLADENSAESDSGVLQIDQRITLTEGRSASVRELLIEKHPPAEKASEDILIGGATERVNPIRFEALTPKLVEHVAIHCQGSAGPSGLDADAWRRFCVMYKGASTQMCQSLSNLAQLLATQVTAPEALEPFLACRLIALDKKPGVRPIGVCEVPRRIVAKAILRVVHDDVEDACGFVQKCSGLPAGQEAAVHAMQQLYEDKSVQGILLVDAKNAFNTLNREAALHNIQHVCPALAVTLQNCYQAPSRLFVSGGGEILSREGTTQGDPLSMPFYALALLPLLSHLKKEHPAVRQAWLADDSAAAGRLEELRKWWDTLCTIGRKYGYHTNSMKTYLLVKKDLLDDAERAFGGTGVQFTSSGFGYLGSAVGELNFVEDFFRKKVQDWTKESEKLAVFAKTEPHAAFAALSHGLRGRYTYLLRTLPAPETLLQSLDSQLVDKLLPALTGRVNFSADELALLRLPARLGVMGLPNFSAVASTELSASKNMTRSQVQEILLQNVQHETPSVRSVHQEAVKERNSAKLFRRKQEVARQKSLLEAWDGKRRRQIEILAEKGSSSWLTALPLEEHGFWLKKQDFRDALALRYDWQLHNIPSTCICGTDFSPDHAMTCSFGGFPTIRHNELRDFIGSVVSEVCHDVEIEPLLQPLDGEVFQARSTTTSQEARADVRATGFWTRREAAFFDVRVFHAGASSYRDKSFSDLCQLHQRAKQLEYEERIINVDHGSFCPLVFATSGATGPLCDRFLKHLAGKIADRDSSEYSCVMAWLRCRISFALLRSAVMCIRGSRSSRRSPVNNANRELSLARPSFLEEG